LDEAMKRNPRSRLEAQIRMHQIANYTIIRNWVGQSTSEDFYELCDQYGLLLWDEFFQPNPSDGPDPTDLDTYVANVRDKILRFRNHPSIAVWCARNEGYPPKRIDDALRKLMAELEPTRLYQASSTAGRGVYSHGPYCWRPPREFYSFDANDIFKTEIGSVSIPTLESIHGMMPEKDWEVIDNDWAEHDLAKGAQRGDKYPQIINERYGQVANLADFARKGQLANYEAFRAMYEGRNAKLFKPCTGVITWMSNPAQPSFVWQIYHHDLEPNASLFAAKKACEPVHIQLNEKTWDVEVINNLPAPVTQSHASLTIYNLDGSTVYQHEFEVQAPPSAETSLGSVEWPANLSAVHFVKLEWHDAAGKMLSDNFYWRALPEQPDNLQALETLPTVTLEAEVARHDDDGKCLLEVKLHNPGSHIALMTHLQLHRQNSGERVLPVYYSDNYVSLAPGEARTISIEAAASDLQGQTPLVMIDGWNIAVKPSASTDAAVALNEEAQVNHWPVTGLPVRIE
jgi:beta-galactosidase/beta-glucuronidase